MAVSLRYAQRLPPVVRAELESLVIQLNAERAALGRMDDVPFLASDFAGYLTMTWTVPQSAVRTNRYTLLPGGLMIWTVDLVGTTVGGTVTSVLRLKIPGGHRARGINLGVLRTVDAGAGAEAGMYVTAADLDYVAFARAGAGNWTAGSTNIRGVMLIEVVVRDGD